MTKDKANQTAGALANALRTLIEAVPGIESISISRRAYPAGRMVVSISTITDEDHDSVTAAIGGDARIVVLSSAASSDRQSWWWKRAHLELGEYRFEIDGPHHNGHPEAAPIKPLGSQSLIDASGAALDELAALVGVKRDEVQP